jgi:hypothetical protein
MAGPSGFCPDCQRAKYQRIDRNRPSSSERGYGDKAWQQVRLQAFLRDGWRCVDCGWEPEIVTLMREAGAEAATADVLEELRRRKLANERHLHGDHILTVEERPDLRLDVSNVATRCNECHGRRTLRDSVSGAAMRANGRQGEGRVGSL